MRITTLNYRGLGDSQLLAKVDLFHQLSRVGLGESVSHRAGFLQGVVLRNMNRGALISDAVGAFDFQAIHRFRNPSDTRDEAGALNRFTSL